MEKTFLTKMLIVAILSGCLYQQASANGYNSTTAYDHPWRSNYSNKYNLLNKSDVGALSRYAKWGGWGISAC